MNTRVPSREELSTAVSAIVNAEGAQNLSYERCDRMLSRGTCCCCARPDAPSPRAVPSGALGRRVFMLLEATFVRKLDDMREEVDEQIARELMRHELANDSPLWDLGEEAVGDCSRWMTVQSCTSQHPLHGPERMLQSQGMWVTTGLLPQKLALEFRLPCALAEVKLHTRFVSELAITVKYADSRKPTDHVAERRVGGPSTPFDELCVRLGGEVVAGLSLTITASTAPFCVVRALTAQGVCIQPDALLRLYRAQPIAQ